MARQLRPDREKSQLRRLKKKPDLSQIMTVSERILGPKNKLLIPIAIYISHKSGTFKLKELGGFQSLSTSGVANACKRARAAMLDNAALVRAVKDIEAELTRTGDYIFQR